MAVFVLIYWLREFHFSTIANRFELRCEIMQLLPLYYKKSILVNAVKLKVKPILVLL